MLSFIKFIFISFFILTITAIFLVVFIYYLSIRSIPDYENSLISEKISKDISIYRDNYAIPYIKSQTDEDAFFGLGYVHAQDRLWQMITLRRMVQGKLAEIFGEDAFNSDLLYRSLDIYDISLKTEKVLSKDTLVLLQAYSNGINKRLNEITEKGLGRGSPEFFLYPPEISPWRPADSIALLKNLGLQMTNKASEESLHAMLSLKKVSEDKINDLLYNNLKQERFGEKKTKINLPSYIKNDIKIGVLEKFNNNQNIGASNIFAVSKGKSATGSTLAATDLHFPLDVPSKIYLAKIDLENGSVIGGSIPGIPSIIVGRNNNIGWGFSSSQIDDQDLFVEKNNPLDENEYFFSGSFKKYDVRKEIINIKNKKGKTVFFKKSINGPVIVGNHFGVNNIRPNGYEITLNWPGLSENDKSIETLIFLMKSNNYIQAKEKLNSFVSPSVNLLLADKENIGILTIGKIPNRNNNHKTKGMSPSIGWQEDNKWEGFLSFNKNPKIENPKNSFVINTNNRISSENFPYHFSYNFDDTQRIVRGTNLLNDTNLHTTDTFVQIQTDSISITARIILPLIAKELWFKNESNEKIDENFSKSLKLLAEWNGNMSPNDPQPLIYSKWINILQKNILEDDLGELLFYFKEVNPFFLEKVFSNIDNSNIWCDIKQTSITETCDFLAKKSLLEAIDVLEKKFGKNIEKWRWGDAHKVIHKSKIFGNIPFVSFFSNIVQEIPGGENTLLLTKNSNNKEHPFYSNYGSVMRAVFDFSDRDNSLFIISSGQSEHFLSKHYDDMSVLWKQNRYINLFINERKNLKGSLRETRIFKKVN